MHKFVLHVKLIGNRLSSQERFPALLTYTSFDKTGEEYGARVTAIKWAGKTRRGVPHSQMFRIKFAIHGEKSYPRDAAIWFHLYTDLKNSKGRYCPESGGFGRVYLAELMEGKAVRRDLVYANVASPDGDGNETLHKGTVCVTVAPARSTGAFLHDAITFKESSLYDYVPGSEERLSQSMMFALNANMMAFNKEALEAEEVNIEPNSEKIRRVHAPIYTASISMPAELYFSNVRMQGFIDEETLEAIATSILKRHRITHFQFQELVKEAKRVDSRPLVQTRVTSLIAEMLGKISTSLPYIGDMADLNKDIADPRHHKVLFKNKLARTIIESFEDAYRKHAGDCEDVDWLAHYVFSSFAYSGAFKAPLMNAIRDMCSRYVGISMLTSVTAANLEGATDTGEEGPADVDSERDQNVKVGAHMVFAMMPRHQYIKMIQWSTENKDLRLPTGASEGDIEDWEKTLEMKVVEGTGRLEPSVLPDEAFVEGETHKRAAVQNSLATEDAYLRLKCGTSVMEYGAAKRAGALDEIKTFPAVNQFKITQRPSALINNPDSRTPFYRMPTQIMASWPPDAHPTFDVHSSEGILPKYKSDDGWGFHAIVPYRVIGHERPAPFDPEAEVEGRKKAARPSEESPIDNWGIDMTDLLNKRWYVAAFRPPAYSDEQLKVMGSLARHLPPMSIPKIPQKEEKEEMQTIFTGLSSVLSRGLREKTSKIKAVHRAKLLIGEKTTTHAVMEYDRFAVEMDDTAGTVHYAKYTHSYIPLLDATKGFIADVARELAGNKYVLDAQLHLEHEVAGVVTMRLDALVDVSTNAVLRKLDSRSWFNPNRV